MSKLSRDDVLKLAALSKLRLSDEEIENLRGELSEILNYVGQLNDVDTSGLKPTYQVTGLVNVSRPDVTKDYGYKTGELLKNAPALLDKQFKVKRVL
ncbi:MAG TPA: Asp-tRNA(Asn)/Glu-tRNA(Gln) amidotransferase subunit GatC [Candidatus Saccharimonadales bacterium]|nr:Asp-tRNA(Asn)/Glu-tRNA(Gln) amidotransferase subunit GatC [Candidatus Saccharimonadales bacterium]